MTMQATSVAARAIAHLRTLKPSTWCTSHVIADAIDSDTTAIAGSLAPYVKRGEVQLSKEGRNNLYSLGAGKRETLDDEPPEADEPRQRVTKAKAGDRAETNGHASVFHAAGPMPHPSTWKGKVATKATRASARKPKKATALAIATVRRQVRRAAVPTPPQPHSLAVALFNTGELVLEVGQQPAFRLSREQTGELIDYLMRLDQLAGSSVRPT